MTPVLLTLALTVALPPRFDAAMAAAMTELHVPGAAIVIVSGDDTLVQTYGMADLATKRPMTPETPFGLQSTSKLFTGLLALELAAERGLDLDADVNTLLRSLQVPPHPGGPVTLRQLLTHRAGFDERGIGLAARSAAALQPLGTFLARELPPRVRAPGTVVSYSNHGFALAGLVLEEAASEPFDRLFDCVIARPLGLSSTTFAVPLPDALASRAATGYMWRDSFVPVEPILFNDRPASALHSTALEMAVLLRALLDGSRPSWRQSLEATFRSDPRLPGVAIGGAVATLRYDMPALTHGGDWQDFFNTVLLIPERRLAILVASNNGEADAFGRAVLDLIEPAMSLTRAQASMPPSTASANVSADIAGWYRSTRHSRHGLEKIGLLTGAVPEYEVRVTPDVMLNGRPLQKVGDDLFRSVSGELFAIQRDAYGAPLLLGRSAVPTVAFEPVPWIRSVRVQRILLGGFLVLFVVRLLLLFRGRRPQVADAALGMHVAFTIGLTVVTASISQWEFQYGVPLVLRAWLLVPWLSMAASGYALIRREFIWGTAAITFVLLLWEWNLVSRHL